MDPLDILKPIVLLLLLPPGSPILLGLAGIVLLRHRPRLGTRLLVMGTVAAYITSIPLTADLLSRLQQPYPPLEPAQLTDSDAQAIVVLAGGLESYAPEWPAGQTIHPRTLTRTRYAAYLARQMGLPVVAVGGYRHREGPAEGELMAQVLEKEFGIDQVFSEQDSQDTWQNAVNTAAILEQHHWNRIILVTHAIHMPRATDIFRRAGLEVVPAPTRFFDDIPNPLDPRSWVPQASDTARIHYLLYEALGRLWYHWRSSPRPLNTLAETSGPT